MRGKNLGVRGLGAALCVSVLAAGLAAGQTSLAVEEWSHTGTVVGSYGDTWAADGLTEAIQEKSKANKNQLEHVWSFEVAPGSLVTFSALGWRTANAEGENFTLMWSVDAQSYGDFSPPLVIAAVGAPGGTVTGALPTGISGSVYVRVKDTITREGSQDTVFIDELVFESVSSDLPAAASDVMAKSTSDSTVVVWWKDNAGNEDEYRVQRSPDGSLWNTEATLGPNATVWTDTGLAASTPYHYRVVAGNGYGETPSESVAVTTRDLGSFVLDKVRQTGGGFWRSHAIDPAGRPGVAYQIYVAGSGYFLEFAHWTGIAWEIEVVDGPRELYGIDVGFSPGGTPWIAYLTGPMGSPAADLRFAEKVGGAWSIEILDEGKMLGPPQLAVDLQGQPAIAHLRRGNPKQRGVFLARRTSGIWSIERIAGEVVDYCGMSLAFDATGAPAIAYGATWPGDELKLARWDGSAWELTVVESGNSGLGEKVYLAFDPIGQPTILHGVMSPTELRLLRWNGASWDLGLVPQQGSPVAVGLAFAAGGDLHLAYVDNETADSPLWHARHDGTAWHTELVDSRLTPGSLRLDALGHPSISYLGRLAGTGVILATK